MLRNINPTMEESSATLLQLLSKYTKTDNEIRTEQVALLKKLAAGNDVNALIGACIFVHASIKSEYRLLNPERSDLYRELTAFLNQQKITSDKTRFVNLIAFIQYAEKNCSDKLIADATNFAAALKCSLNADINTLCDRPPTPEALQKNFAKLVEEYRKQKQDISIFSKIFSYLGIGDSTANREQAMKLTDLLNARCNAESSINPEIAYIKRYGALLFYMWQIDSEYIVRSPECSRFYRQCQQLTNIKSTAEIENKIVKQDLSCLLAHCSEAIVSPGKAAEDFDIDVLIKAQNELITALNDFKSQSAPLASDSRVNRALNSFCSVVSSAIAQSSIGIGVAAVIEILSHHHLKFRMVLNLMAPEYAILFLGLWWAQKQLQSNMAAVISNPVTPIVRSAITAPFYGYAALRTFFGGRQQEVGSVEDNLPFLRALHMAPLDVVSQEEKDRLELVFDELSPSRIDVRCIL